MNSPFTLIDRIKQMSTRISYVVKKHGDVEKIMTKEYIEGVEMLDLDPTK